MSTRTEPRAGRRRLTADARREIIERAATEVFAEHGYQGASMDEIAGRSQVSVPVLYDHFASKQQLHCHLLERHFAELRELWREQLGGAGTQEERLARSVHAWFAYVQSHPYAWRMLFREPAGDPEVRAIHREVSAQSRALLLPLIARESGIDAMADASAEGVEMVWEVFRAVLQGLALWWYEHQHVPRRQVVATALNALWVGTDRVIRGEVSKDAANGDG